MSVHTAALIPFLPLLPQHDAWHRAIAAGSPTGCGGGGVGGGALFVTGRAWPGTLRNWFRRWSQSVFDWSPVAWNNDNNNNKILLEPSHLE